MEFINLSWSQLKAPYYPPCDREGLAGEWVKLWQGCYNFSDSSISYLQTPGLYCPCLRNLQIEITLEDSTFKPVSYCPPRMSAPKMRRIYLANLFKWGPIGYSGHTMTRLMLSSSGPTSFYLMHNTKASCQFLWFFHPIRMNSHKLPFDRQS